MFDLPPGIDIILLVLSLLIVGKGGDWVVKHSSYLAKRLNISPLIIGLTIVAFGTSLPEFAVSFIAGVKGNSGISIGNVVGSNIVNIGLIVGITATIYPLSIQLTTLLYEMPFLLVSSFLLILLSNDRNFFNKETFSLGTLDGIILLFVFALFLLYIFKNIQKQKETVVKEYEKEFAHKNNLWKDILFIVLGLVMLILGGNTVIKSSVEVAKVLGIAESFIGLSVIAIGTSLPELVVGVTAILKKEADIAVGNVVGSNIFNILFILGTSSLFRQIIIEPKLLYIDMTIMIIFTFLFLLFTTTKKTISRIEGLSLLIFYIAYILYLISNQF